MFLRNFLQIFARAPQICLKGHATRGDRVLGTKMLEIGLLIKTNPSIRSTKVSVVLLVVVNSGELVSCGVGGH